MVGTAAKWSYFNVLEMLLANLPEGDYKADVGAWANGILKLRERYESKYPELFSQIHFVDRPPAPPYSKQVSDFFVYQAFGGIKEAVNPAYEKMNVSPEAKEELRKRNPALSEQPYGEALAQMASLLAKELRLS